MRAGVVLRALVLLVLVLARPAWAAQTAEAFYRGKTISYIVATSPGGDMTPMGG